MSAEEHATSPTPSGVKARGPLADFPEDAEKAHESLETLKLYEHGYTGSTPHFGTVARHIAWLEHRVVESDAVIDGYGQNEPPLVKGALDAQAEAEREVFRLRGLLASTELDLQRARSFNQMVCGCGCRYSERQGCRHPALCREKMLVDLKGKYDALRAKYECDAP